MTTTRGIYVSVATTLPTVTTAVGIDIPTVSGGATNWAIRAATTAQSALAGNLRIGSTTAPTVALDVTGAALISSTLGVAGSLSLTGSSSIVEIGSTDGVLVIDGSGFPMKGEESVGVARQYCGRMGKVDSCQIGVFLGPTG